ISSFSIAPTEALAWAGQFRSRCGSGPFFARVRCMANPVSSANLFGHPIHPMLIPFPIAFFVATLVCDLAFGQTGYPIWITAATWLLGAGLIMAALAAAAGLTDFLGDGRIRNISAAWQHAIGNVIAVAISLFNFYW